jgi:hypothetical protein
MLSAGAFAQLTPGNFTAEFESGNIANVQQVGVDSFTFEIRLDDNHGDTYGWYYFAIAGGNGHDVTLFLTNPDAPGVKTGGSVSRITSNLTLSGSRRGYHLRLRRCRII